VAGILQYMKAEYLRRLKRWDDAQACCQLAKAQEIEAFVQTGGSPVYGENLYLTFDLMIRLYIDDNKNGDADRVRLERAGLWWKMAEELAKSYRGEGRDANLPEIIAFFEHALGRNLLDRERLKTEPVFEELRAAPQFNKLLL
jgi:hypothetical protein